VYFQVSHTKCPAKTPAKFQVVTHRLKRVKNVTYTTDVPSTPSHSYRQLQMIAPISAETTDLSVPRVNTHQLGDRYAYLFSVVVNAVDYLMELFVLEPK